MRKSLKPWVIVAAVMAASLAVGISPAHALVPSQTPGDSWMTNGKVYATELSEDGRTLYIGGKFTQVRENPSGAAGSVVRVNNLAAIDVASGTAIREWNPRVTGDATVTKPVVRSLLVKDGRVFVGGTFAAVGGQPRQNLAAVSATDGTVDPFAPAVTMGAQSGTPIVFALLANDAKLFVGGAFYNVDGTGRKRMAAFDLATGALDPAWNPTADRQVLDLEFDTQGASIFASGTFRSVTGSDDTPATRQSVSRFYTDTGNLHPWAIPSGVISGPQNGWDLVATPTRLYGGFGAKPNYAAAFRLDNGNTGSQLWRYSTVGNVQTVELAPDNSRLFIGGHFGTYRLRQSVCGGTDNLHGLASLNPNTGTIFCDWIPQLEPSVDNFDGVWDMAMTEDAASPNSHRLWVGGRFTSMNGVAQQNLATFAYGPINYPPRVDLDGYRAGGLDATYFDNVNFTGSQVTRTDSTVNFNFGTGSPHPSISADTFSALWTGQLEAPVSGQYTLTTQSDDGVRLIVDGKTLVDNFTDHGATYDSGTITLVAGQRYDIRLEYYENGGDAVARLFWQYPGQSLQTIPSNRLLYSGSSGYAATFIEGDGPQSIVGGNLAVTDLNDANLRSATVTIADRPDGIAESLSADTSGTTISATYDSQTGILTLTGPSPKADFERVLRSVAYDNTAPNPSGTVRTVTFVLDDGADYSNTANSTVTFR